LSIPVDQARQNARTDALVAMRVLQFERLRIHLEQGFAYAVWFGFGLLKQLAVAVFELVRVFLELWVVFHVANLLRVVVLD